MAGLIIAIVAAAVAVVGSVAALGWWLSKRLKPADAGADERVKQLEIDLEGRKVQIDKLTEEIKEVKDKRDALQGEKDQLAIDKATAETNANNLKAQREQLNELLAKLKEDTKSHLKEVTEDILTKNKQEMKEDVEQRTKSIYDTVKPLKDNIDNLLKDSVERHTELTTTVEELQKNAKNYGESADNLAKALTGGSKVQGNWGEVTFENLIEDSGLHRSDYEKQSTMRGEEGEIKRPDFLIKLPEQKYLIVDSKVSLRAYEEYMNETEKMPQEAALDRHVKAVENHIKELSEKDYEFAQHIRRDSSPDFVFLFMPIEHSFLVVLKKKPQLFREAYSKKVILCVPTSAMAVLRTVELIWRQERQTRNVEEISRLGGQLYDKIAGFVETMERVRKAQETAIIQYNKAYGQLKDGRGNMLSIAERLRAKGVPTKKILPDVSDSEDQSDEVEQGIGES